MKTPPAAACDLEAAAVHTGSAAAVAAQLQQPAVPAANQVAQEEDDPRLRWEFMRKVHAILSMQFALTAAVAATASFVRPVHRFFACGPPAAVWPTLIVIVVSPIIVMFPMLEDREMHKHPTRNRVLLALFTLCCSISIALSTCTAVAGK